VLVIGIVVGDGQAHLDAFGEHQDVGVRQHLLFNGLGAVGLQPLDTAGMAEIQLERSRQMNLLSGPDGGGEETQRDQQIRSLLAHGTPSQNHADRISPRQRRALPGASLKHMRGCVTSQRQSAPGERG